MQQLPRDRLPFLGHVDGAPHHGADRPRQHDGAAHHDQLAVGLLDRVDLGELGQLAQRPLPHEARVPHQRRRVVVLRAELGLARDPQHRRLVARRDGDDGARDEQPLLLGEVLCLPKVDEADAAVVEQHDVARVRVAREEAVAQHLVAQHGAERAHGRLDVDHRQRLLVLFARLLGDAADGAVVQRDPRVDRQRRGAHVALQQRELEPGGPRRGAAVAERLALRLARPAVLHHLLLELVDRDALRLGVGLRRPLQPVEQRPARELRHDQHVLRDHVWVDELGHAHLREGARQVAPDLLHHLGLAPEVELGHELLAELGHLAHRLRRPEVARAHELREVRVEEAAHLRVLHLDHHLAPVEQPRAVHLPDGRRAQRVVVEPAEDVRDRLAERLGDDRVHLVRRLGRHARLQLLQLLPVHLGHDVHHREHLPELDVEAAQLQDQLQHARRVPLVQLVVRQLEVGLLDVGLPAPRAHRLVVHDHHAHQPPEGQRAPPALAQPQPDAERHDRRARVERERGAAARQPEQVGEREQQRAAHHRTLQLPVDAPRHLEVAGQRERDAEQAGPEEEQVPEQLEQRAPAEPQQPAEPAAGR